MKNNLTIHKDLLQRNVYAVVKDWHHSEELVNDTLLKAYDEIEQGRYNEQNKIEGWLLKIARYKALDFLDSQKRNVLAHYISVENLLITEDESVYQYDEKKVLQVYKALYSLRKKRRQYNVLMLHYLHGLSISTIAEMTGEKVNDVWSRNTNGIANLKKAYN